MRTHYVAQLVGAEGRLCAQIRHACGHTAEHLYAAGHAEDLVGAQGQPCNDCRQDSNPPAGSGGARA
jgi:hypothetical protein